uniref:Cytochrome c oxidase subunit 7C, mitochondrial n=1 Tax=Propithecus coquereli TaxID=379532 RepID=A0A2K6FA20_PROCO
MLAQSIQRFTTSVVRRSHYDEGPRKNLPFSVRNKWRFATPFFTVRHQLLKKMF